MIKVKMLSGSYVGQERVVPPEISARDLLGDCLVKKWSWSVDYTAATEDEAYEWGWQDLSCRIIRALGRGLPVMFLGKEYRLADTEDPEELWQIAGAIEDAIASSGHLVTIGYDDARGVGIADLRYGN